MQKSNSTRSAFTLVELLVIVAVLVALVATMIAVFDPFERKGEAYDAERGIHTRQIYKAINDYLWDQNYPPTDFPAGGEYKWICQDELTGTDCTDAPPIGISGVDLKTILVDGGYLTEIPDDPVFSNSQSASFRLTLSGDYYIADSPYSGIYHPPPDPIAWWKLDETSIGTATESVGGYDGTHQNMTVGNITADLPPTNLVNARTLLFDGTEDYIQTTYEDLKTLDDFAISFWFKADVTTGSHHMLWQGRNDLNGWGEPSQPGTHELHLSIGRMATDDLLVFFYGYEDSPGDFAPAVEISTIFTDTTSWHHVAVNVEDAGSSPQATLYLDGYSVGGDTGTQTDRSNWDTALKIGRPGAAQRYHDGFIDDVRVYDVLLSDEQIGWMADGLF